MDDPYVDPLPHGDFRPEDFRTPTQGGIEISASFVETTLARVLGERAETRAEAERVEEIAFAPEFLARYEAPSASDDFVARTWSRIQDERSREEARLDTLITTFGVPSARPDFVARTLEALRVDRSGLRLVGDGAEPAHTASRSGWRVAAVAAAAALVVGLVWGFWPRTLPIESTIESAQRFTPVAWGTALERINERAAGGIRFEPVDPLQMLAAEAAGGRR